MKNKIIVSISFGIIAQWLSLFFSYQKIQDSNINQSIATGGFPLKIFEYPFPPMGHDWPPVEYWPMFFLNLFIWIVVGFLISFLFSKKTINKKAVVAFVIFSIALSLLGIFYIMLKFD
jgi:hypothetical protein